MPQPQWPHYGRPDAYGMELRSALQRWTNVMSLGYLCRSGLSNRLSRDLVVARSDECKHEELQLSARQTKRS